MTAASLTCATCGNPVDPDDPICPYCSDWERVDRERSSGATRRIDLGHRRLSAQGAASKLSDAVRAASHSGDRLLKVVTGYGSSGGGGKIRGVLLSECHRMKARGDISQFASGEELGSGTNRGRAFAQAYPNVRTWPEWESGNEGVIAIGL